MVLVGDAAHAMPPFLGQGANQAIQDGYCLASQLAQIGAEHETLSDALAAYQSIRKFPTAKLTFNSWFLGFIETQRGLGAAFRDKFFNTMYRLGVAQFVFLDGATPKVGGSPGGK
jgi:salicylate hydroxylase